jgi:sugar lactone lactonase YvrE
LLISDDYNDVIYRVSYGEDKKAKKNVTSQTNTQTITGLMTPESAIAAPDGRVFITEIGEFGVKGDGKVSIIHRDGKKTTLATGLNDPKGIDLWNDELYIADVDHVVKVDMDGKVTVIADTKAFPGKPVFLNDMEIDGNGTLFVSDSGTDKGENAGIYQITQAGKVSVVLDDSSAIKRPNGLLLDGNDTLLVADFGSGNLYRTTISSGKTEALNKGFGAADGLIRDSKGYLYVSDWQNGKVWQLVEPKATPQLISDEFVAAADLGISADGQSIMVPDMKAGKLIYLPIQ